MIIRFAVPALLALSLVAAAQPSRGYTSQGRIAPDAIAGSAEGAAGQDYIIQYRDTTDLGTRNVGRLAFRSHTMKMSAGRLNRTELELALADPEVLYVSPDRTVSATHFPPWMLNEAIGYRFAAMTVPERPEVSGKGIGIAIIDSGISADAYLKGYASGCTASRVVYAQNFVTTESTTDDLYGHGTHVAGIAAGDGRCLTGAYQDFRGVAPEATLINLRALDSRGQGKDSYVVAAIDRAIALKSTYNIRVINLSLGRVIRESFSLDPLTRAVERAWKAGIAVVVAAGNNGRDNSMGTNGYSTITSPGNDPYVLTVGATRMAGSTAPDDDTVTSYSSKGPSLLDHAVKPDLVAPGNIVYARMTPAQYLVQSYQSNSVGVSMGMGPTIENVFLLSGTSMAAPVGSGSMALLFAKNPTLTVDQAKARLMKTALKTLAPYATIYDVTTATSYFVQHDIFTVGAGYLDLKAALASTEKIGSTQRALSPRAVFSNGQVTLSNSYPSISSTGIVWGTGVAWGTGIVWGTNQFVSGTGIVWGTGVVWGTTTPQAFGIVWGSGVTWGTSDPFNEALSIKGDRDW
jgi:serine protease AprX